MSSSRWAVPMIFLLRTAADGVLHYNEEIMKPLFRSQRLAHVAFSLAGACLTVLGIRLIEPLFTYGVEPHYPFIFVASIAVTYMVIWLVHRSSK